MIILQNNIQNAINQTHVRIRCQCCQHRVYLMDTVPQTVNCVDVLPRTSRHFVVSSRTSHLLWTSLEPGHCHCAVCLMEPHMNISKPSVNKSNTFLTTKGEHL